MLNEHERHQLEAIEEVLLRDPDLSACFGQDRPRAVPRRYPRPRCLVIPGVLIMATATFLGLGGVFAQGLGLVALGLVWSTATNALVRGRVNRSLKHCVEALDQSWFRPPL
ncbi:MAG TPA: DUF3040 domain-containing protein [Kineosporiaceae bacterium]|nr:DUF3040 domain-containing protein [Kineosporiaceae bacterium]